MSETQEKKNPASQRKLKKQRDKGSIPSSAQLSGSLAAAITFVLIYLSTEHMIDTASRILSFDENTFIDLKNFGVEDRIRNIGILLLAAIVPIVFISKFSIIIIALIVNGGFLTSLTPIKPDFSKLSPSAGVKRIFGKRAWTEFFYEATYTILWISFVVFILITFLPRILNGLLCEFDCQTQTFVLIFRIMLIGVVTILLLIAGFSWRLQLQLFLNEQKMTESEVTKEKKDQQGSDEVRRERNRIRSKLRNQPAKVALSEVNYVFFHNDNAVAVSFDPPDKKLPIVLVVSSNNPEKKRIIIEKSKKYTNNIIHNELITMSSLQCETGDYLPEQTLRELSKEYWQIKRSERN